MTATLTLQSHLIAINQELQIFLSNLEEQMQSANQYSTEALSRFKDRLLEYYHEWQDIAQRSRMILGSLPREIAHRKISKDFKRTLEGCEINVGAWYNKLNRIQVFEGTVESKGAREKLIAYLNKMSAAASQLAAPIGSLQSHPLFQRFLEGDRILASRSQLQWMRKAFHAGAGLFGLWLYGYSGLSTVAVTWILVACFSGAVATEILRRIYPSVNEKICNGLGGMMRERERHNISSSTWYMGAILVVFLCFPKGVGMLALYFTAVGDTVAGIVGSHWGRHKLGPHVSIEGCLAAFLVCFFGTFLMAAEGLPSFQVAGAALVVFSLLAALVATLAEASFKKWDDNLVIPLLSAPFLLLLMHIFRQS